MKSGGCLCGAVRYELRGASTSVTYCHCAMCRRWHGHVGAYAAVDRTDLVIVQPLSLKWHASSPNVRRGFCAECGSSLFFDDATDGKVGFCAGTLDEPTDLPVEGPHLRREQGRLLRAWRRRAPPARRLTLNGRGVAKSIEYEDIVLGVVSSPSESIERRDGVEPVSVPTEATVNGVPFLTAVRTPRCLPTCPASALPHKRTASVLISHRRNWCTLRRCSLKTSGGGSNVHRWCVPAGAQVGVCP